MISRAFGEHFSRHWIEAWNSHDLHTILSHYAEDFVMSSPYITQITGEPSGTLQGKTAVGAYWAAALVRVPDLRFELIQTLLGADSITICYRGARGLAAEVFFFNQEGLVVRAAAHYE
jgi:hypothetical protein